MNVDQALCNIEESDCSIEGSRRRITTEARILGGEVKRLREQLKKQEEDFEFYRIEGTLYGTKYWICGTKEKKMNVEYAMEYMSSSSGSSEMSRVLYTEVIRLRGQRKLLSKEVIRLVNCSPSLMGFCKGIGPILDEVDAGKQEKEEKEKKEEMKVDQALFLSGKYGSAARILGKEVKRLRGLEYMKGEAIDGLNAEVKSLRQVHIEKNSEINRLRGEIATFTEERELKDKEIRQLRRECQEVGLSALCERDNYIERLRREVVSLRLEKDEEIDRLQKVINEKDEGIKAWKKNRKELGKEVHGILNSFGV